MKEIIIKEDFITLGNFLKYSGFISCGGEAKFFLNESIVLVNGQEEKRRGCKLKINDIVKIKEKEYKIIKKEFFE